MLNDYLKRAELERSEGWREKWIDKIPAIKFKEDWEVKVIPPFSGAMVRFWIDKGDKHVSVYLDCFERLGFSPNGGPYWEIYPYEHDVYRVVMDDTEELIRALSRALD